MRSQEGDPFRRTVSELITEYGGTITFAGDTYDPLGAAASAEAPGLHELLGGF